jgi:hypothetical protein
MQRLERGETYVEIIHKEEEKTIIPPPNNSA